MSVHILNPIDPAHEVRAGYDPPFKHFFILVFDLEKEKIHGEESVIVSEYYSASELHKLVHSLSRYASVPDNLMGVLLDESVLPYPESNKITRHAT